MVVTYKQLKLINFPIYALPSSDVNVEDGILYHQFDILDDRNQIGGTLGARRLQTPHKVKRLAKCYLDIQDLLTCKNQSVFIDNKGFVFIYERTKFAKIIYIKILKVLQKENYTVLKLAGNPTPVIVRRPPPPGKLWVGMLYLDNTPWVPYEYSEEKCTSKRRKI